MDKVSMSYLLAFVRYQTKCIIKLLFRQLMTHKLKIYLRSSSKAMADREKKRGRRKQKKINISRTKR